MTEEELDRARERQDSHVSFFARNTKRQWKENDAFDIGGRTIHVGEGVSHMVGLIHIVEHSNEAGLTIPRVIMRDGSDHSHESIYTQSELRALLAHAAHRENELESVHNLVMSDYHRRTRKRDDKTLSLEERTAGANEAEEIVQNYDKQFLATHDFYTVELEHQEVHLRSYDLPTLKAVYLERIESAATGHQKHIKGALSQQAIDNWAACVEMDDALKEIAKQCTLAVIDLTRVQEEYVAWKKIAGAWVSQTTGLPNTYEHQGDEEPSADLGADDDWYRERKGHAAATAAFDAGVAAIQAVTALNTPHWRLDGILIAQSHPNRQDLIGRTVTIRAVHPAGKSIEGNISLAVRVTEGVATTTLQTLTPPDFQYHVTIPADASDAVEIECTARSICGPSKVTVRLVPPSE